MVNDPHSSQAVLGPFSATCIVVGAIIGIGIFFNPTSVALVTGSTWLAMTTWAVGGVIALLGALTFAELGSIYTRNGGQYQILKDAFSAPVGFVYVFCNATIIQAGAIAIIGYFASVNLGVAINGRPFSNDMMHFAMAGVMIVGLTFANAIGVRWGSGIQNATVIAKLVTLVAIILLAFLASSFAESTVAENPDAAEALSKIRDASPFALIFAGLVPVFFSMGGWQHALWIGGEVKRPHRNIPLAIIVGLIIVTTVYLAVNWAYFQLLGFDGVVNSEALAADAVGAVWPDIGSRLVGGAIFVSGFGVLNVQLLSGPRLIYGMAHDGKFFSPFAKLSPVTGTPLAAIFMLGGLGLAILLAARSADRIDTVLNGVVLVDAFFFLLTAISLFRLRQRQKRLDLAEPPFKVPFYPFVPALFAIGEVLIIGGAIAHPDPKYRNGLWIGITWIVAAVVCYFLFFRQKDSRQDSTKS